MKLLVKKTEVKKFTEHNISVFSEYSLPFNNAAVGISEINGRYPEKGYDLDQKIEQIWYIEKGSGKIWVMDEIYFVGPGDMILIPKAKKYWIEGKALKLVVISSPPWFAEQHIHLDA